jgi:arginine N-succinyltransferase
MHGSDEAPENKTAAMVIGPIESRKGNCMMVLRPIRHTDLESLLAMAGQAGYGMTTLPPDKTLLQRRIEESMDAFVIHPEKPRGETYLFILEDTATGRPAGVCGMVSKVGGFDPFFSYRIRGIPLVSPMLGLNKTMPVLELTIMYDGPAIVGSLFLLPEYRKDGNGRLLSLARFLFMAQFPQRFDPHVIAEMRGKIEADGRSPFWDAVGRHFFDIDFPRADYLTMVDKKFIVELMPRHPIYIPLLGAAAQEAIGKVHPATQPALKILQDEGFVFENMVDIFEAGAVVGCPRDQIRTVRESRVGKVRRIAELPQDAQILGLSNTTLDFRACRAGVLVDGDGGVQIDSSSAKALSVQAGDDIRYVTLRSGTVRGTDHG